MSILEKNEEKVPDVFSGRATKVPTRLGVWGEAKDKLTLG